jgi:hypothetical protein
MTPELKSDWKRRAKLYRKSPEYKRRNKQFQERERKKRMEEEQNPRPGRHYPKGILDLPLITTLFLFIALPLKVPTRRRRRRTGRTSLKSRSTRSTPRCPYWVRSFLTYFFKNFSSNNRVCFKICWDGGSTPVGFPNGCKRVGMSTITMTNYFYFYFF